MMSTQTFEASSVDKALEEAANTLGVAAGELQYEVEEKASDFWGLGDTVYVVTVALPEAEPAPAEESTEEPEPVEAVAEVASEAPLAEEAPEDAAEEATTEQEGSAAQDTPSFFTETERAPAEEAVAAATEPAEAPVSETAHETEEAPTPVIADTPAAAAADQAPTETAPADGADLTKEAAGILDGIFTAMGFECTADAKLDGDTMQVAITGEDNQYLLEGRGRGLAALELILNHSFRAWPDRAHKRVRVDAGDFRSQRDDEIRDMAYQVAHRAKETGTEQQTSDLNPYERRIVHLTLAEDHRVTTRSLGNGFLKAVNVIPTEGRQRRDQ